MSFLFVPLPENNPDRIFREIKKYPEADGFEVWIDQFENLTEQIVERFCRKFRKITSKKLLIACKDRCEQGKFSWSRNERLNLLLAASRGGADMIDIADLPFETKTKSTLIGSYHNFKKTPSPQVLRKKMEQLQRNGATIIKIACRVHELKDNETLMTLALEMRGKKLRHIVIGMGEKGMLTRAFSDQIGNEITFVAGEKRTADGQISLQDFLHIQRIWQR